MVAQQGKLIEAGSALGSEQRHTNAVIERAFANMEKQSAAQSEMHKASVEQAVLAPWGNISGGRRRSRDLLQDVLSEDSVLRRRR